MITRVDTNDPLALAAAAAEIEERCLREQGLPSTLQDPLVIDQLATLLDVTDPTQRGRTAA